MRNIITKKSGMLALACLGLCAGSARANEAFIKVPFPFVVGRQTLPAGEYVIRSLDTNPSVTVIKSRNLHDRVAAFVVGEPASGQDPAGDKPAMTFTHDRAHNEYRLSSIWQARTLGEDVSKY